jgi:hypothetical protein
MELGQAEAAGRRIESGRQCPFCGDGTDYVMIDGDIIGEECGCGYGVWAEEE